jgi:hypothetical protein
MLLPDCNKPVGNSTLIENLDRSNVQSSGPRSNEILVRAPLNDGNVNARQRQLGC